MMLPVFFNGELVGNMSIENEELNQYLLFGKLELTASFLKIYDGDPEPMSYILQVPQTVPAGSTNWVEAEDCPRVSRCLIPEGGTHNEHTCRLREL